VVKHRSTSPNRVLRNALMASALAAGLTAVSTIRPASAHVDHGQRNDAHYSARFGGAVDWRQNHRQRRGVRDRLLASSSGSGHHSRQLTNNRRSLGGSGVASVYSDRHTASGERMNSGAMTAAHRPLPFGTMVAVIKNHTSRSVVVRINDRGPFVHGRIIDLSPAAAGNYRTL
jgi:rare lipoprotein A (peptidoglycan hydrolase)